MARRKEAKVVGFCYECKQASNPRSPSFRYLNSEGKGYFTTAYCSHAGHYVLATGKGCDCWEQRITELPNMLTADILKNVHGKEMI